ncbi:MAG: hypothetical protein Q9206_005145, partial [Seirophora lacunosa]
NRCLTAPRTEYLAAQNAKIGRLGAVYGEMLLRTQLSEGQEVLVEGQLATAAGPAQPTLGHVQY